VDTYLDDWPGSEDFAKSTDDRKMIFIFIFQPIIHLSSRYEVPEVFFCSIAESMGDNHLPENDPLP
jgi:hypothetical protein